MARKSSFVLDYHEGMSENQAKIVLHELGFTAKDYRAFTRWLYGQTCPMIPRYDEEALDERPGVYEYDLFRWIAYKRGEK